MGKRTRKTRWRTLPIGDEQSDSEESNSTLDTRIPPTYHQKYYSSRFSYSSQSTPTRRYQGDSTKSTRSSSTASENKITFNEDEYTRITTPRQDVLFKKGYLNKPKTYSTQTSTGNSTTSTGNSTGNGTPDYQSTDLEYESHFVFPNGFLDQNGIYYVNGFDSYPLMVYNAPTYYNNDVCSRAKKYSTESLAETGSTTNEEFSPDGVNHEPLAGEEASSHHQGMRNQQPTLTNGHPLNHHPQSHHDIHQHQQQQPSATEYGHQVYNVVYPSFYYNGMCPQDLANGHDHQSEPKKIKRRRRRKLPNGDAHQHQNGTASEYTEDEVSSVEEEDEEETSDPPPSENPSASSSSVSSDRTTSPAPSAGEKSNDAPEILVNNQSKSIDSEEIEKSSSNEEIKADLPINITGCDKNELISQDNTAPHNYDTNINDKTLTNNDNITNNNNNKDDTAEISLSVSDNITSNEKKNKYDLKPDAQEFVPRAMRPESMHYFKMAPNFVHLPLVNPNVAPQNLNYNQAFLPPGIPVNFIQQGPHVYPGYVANYVPPNVSPEHAQLQQNNVAQNADLTNTNSNPHQQNSPVHHHHHCEHKSNKGGVDINTVVSKLEEVVNDPPKPDNPFDKRSKPNTSVSKKQKHYDQKFFLNNKNSRYNQNKTHNRQNIHGHENSTNADQITYKTNKKEEIVPTEENSVKICLPPEILLAEEKNNRLQTAEANTPNSIQESNHHVTTKTPTRTTPTITKYSNDIKVENEKKSKEPEKVTVTEERNKNLNSFVDPIKKRWPRHNEKRDQHNIQQLEEKYNQYHQRERNNQTYKNNQNSPNQTPNRRFGNNMNSPLTRKQIQNCQENNVKKYSETVKKINNHSFIKVPRENKNVIEDRETSKPDKPDESNNTPSINNKSQWISVSNKKNKRRSRNQEEQDDVEQIGNECDQNDFLQKMIMKSKSKHDDQIKNTIDEIPDVIKKSPVKILEVRDIEKELLNNVGVEVTSEINIIDNNTSSTLEEKVSVPEQQKPITKSNNNNSNKKKMKKNPPQSKQPIKRVIITDIDLSEGISEGKIEEGSEENRNVLEENAISESAIEESNVSLKTSSETKETRVEDEMVPITDVASDKKGKKKKKKSSKTSNSITSNNNWEDSYDLLLENTFLNNSEDKTNMEVSQELDLIIQRGMYNSLEEKIKSLNIIPIKEEFFQNVVRTSRESSIEKTQDFSKFLSNSIPKFKYCMASVEDNVPNNNKLPLTDLDQPSTSKNCIFVENQEVNELLQNIYGKEGTPEMVLEETVKKPPADVTVETQEETPISKESSIDREVIDKEKLYPITQAVKNWMTKTRECTPEVEILKSPSVIFREFCENGVNGRRCGSVAESEEEEVTIFSASRKSSDDLHEPIDCYWENEISQEEKPISRKTSEENGFISDNKEESDIKEDEILEIYESKYGQNEDFIELQKEIEEKKKQENEARSRNFPKHGALPYRAICCSIM